MMALWKKPHRDGWLKKLCGSCITFRTSGYDAFIDFIKAYAILCVLIGHTFPFLHETGYPLWYGMQVPLFVLIQVFHVFRRENYSFNLKQMFQRIMLPYLIVQILPLGYVVYRCMNGNCMIINYIERGGYGPGSYFPWLYMQLALILSIVKPWLDRRSKIQNLIIALIICESFEIMSSVIGLPDWLYRLLPIRYFFLIYLGWIWVKEGIVLNAKNIVLSMISMGTIIYFEYLYTPTYPWFYDTAWRCHRWPCYFYVSTLLCGVLYWIYSQTKSISFVKYSTRLLAQCSYEIFLIQMIAIPFMPKMLFVENAFLRYGIRTGLILLTSIMGGYFFHRLYKVFIKSLRIFSSKNCLFRRYAVILTKQNNGTDG